MKTVASLLIPTTVILGLAASSPAAETRNREARLVRVHHTQGVELIGSALSAHKPAARLRALRKAVAHLRRAHRLARRLDGEAAGSVRAFVAADLVRAANGLARINLDRGSLPRARKWNALALLHDADDADALNLEVAIRADEQTDIYDETRGSAAILRIRERRRAAGLPLRNRGHASRR